VPRQGMNDGTLFVEINQNLLTVIKQNWRLRCITEKKKIETATTNFKSAKFWMYEIQGSKYI
jgi:hypothetical protein